MDARHLFRDVNILLGTPNTEGVPNAIRAIKLVREHTGLGLRGAKCIVDALSGKAWCPRCGMVAQEAAPSVAHWSRQKTVRERMERMEDAIRAGVESREFSEDVRTAFLGALEGAKTFAQFKKDFHDRMPKRE